MKSSQLAEFIRTEKVTIGKNSTPAINVHYKRLDGEKAGTEMSVRYLVGRLDESSLNVLKALTPSSKFVVEKEKQGEYWNLTGFKPESSFVEKPASTWKPGGYSGGAKKTYEKDATGVKVGASRNQAIAYLSASSGFTGDIAKDLDTIDKVSALIVTRQAKQEETLRGKKDEPLKLTEEHFTTETDTSTNEIPW